MSRVEVSPISNPLSLRRNFSWTLMGNVVYTACQWGMLVVIARLGSPEKVGQFTLGLAVTAPVILLTNLQLRDVQATDANRQYEFGDYLSLRMISTIISLLIILGIIALADYSREAAWVIFFLGMSRALDALSDIFYGFIQLHERMARIAISMMLKGGLSLLLLGVGMYVSHSVVGGAIGLMIASLLVLIGYDFYSILLVSRQAVPPEKRNFSASNRSELRSLRPQWQWKKLRKLTAYALPLGLVMLLFSLNVNIPRYLVEWHLGEHTLGIFAAIASLPLAGNMVMSALGQAAIPRLAKYYAAGNRAAFRTLLLKSVGVGGLLGGIGVGIVLLKGQELLTLLFGEEYGQQADLLVWLMIPAAIGYAGSFLGNGMTAAHYFRAQIPLFVTVTTVTTVASLWLLPIMGLYGIAIALLLAVFVQVAISSGVIIHALHKVGRQV
ncbi:lipopolysaccharide biosynthesis protein [Egbenema bharatensis]|uniref:lipopolysaccharide biosynthesis protein n=1 Tax=Egbenema bharatensis TaxID=3463334 RepID=UPI003A839D35